MGAQIRYAVEGGVAIVTLSQVPANAYDLDTLRALDAKLVDARFDANVHVIVVTGDGDRFFSVGADTDMLREATLDYRNNFCLYTHEVLHRLEHSPKLTICAINGHCIGGGLELALACDLRVSRTGKINLSFPEVSVGMMPASGGTQRLPRLVGKGRALKMMLEGTPLSIERAAEIGLVETLWSDVTPEAFGAKVLDYARSFTPPQKAALAVGKIKRAVQSGLEGSLEEGLALERELAAQLFASEDAKTGFAAFAAKQKPEFRGR
jgi:enoyl-CoA hydratase/carnithine racemase